VRLADGVSLWLVRLSGTRYLTICVILTLAETAPDVYLLRTGGIFGALVL